MDSFKVHSAFKADLGALGIFFVIVSTWRVSTGLKVSAGLICLMGFLDVILQIYSVYKVLLTYVAVVLVMGIES